MKILFLCTGNSCRSQMAEGWTKHLNVHLKTDVIDAYSAGIEIHGLNPHAVKVMQEAGVDISNHESTHVDQFSKVKFDYVITVCSHADKYCPVFPGTTHVVHKGFDDPPGLAEDAISEEERLPHYRRVRDEIRQYVSTLPDSLSRSQT